MTRGLAVRVLDLADVSGVFCTRLLVGLGADVIRVEPPGGDPMRVGDPLGFAHGNAGKRSVTLDLGKPDGTESFRRLAETADIVVETFPPGHLEVLGLGDDELRRVRPELIMVSISPFGRTGPRAGWRGTNLTASALGGMTSLCGGPDGPPLTPPREQAYHLAGVNHRKVRRWIEVQAGLEAMAKPVIAAINGYALGGGAELTLACDARFMAEDARLGFPEIELGIFPGAGGTQRLARLLGPARVLRLMVEGRRLTAMEAESLGLVDRVLPKDVLLSTVHDYARDLARKPTRAIGLLKRCVYGGWGRPLHEGLELEARAVFELIETADAREGLAAFLEKRSPRFTGS